MTSLKKLFIILGLASALSLQAGSIYALRVPIGRIDRLAETLDFVSGYIDIEDLGKPIKIILPRIEVSNLEDFKKLLGEGIMERLGIENDVTKHDFPHVLSELVRNAFEHSQGQPVEVEIAVFLNSKNRIITGISIRQRSSTEKALQRLRINKQGFERQGTDYFSIDNISQRMADGAFEIKERTWGGAGLETTVGSFMKINNAALVYGIGEKEPFPVETDFYVDLNDEGVRRDFKKRLDALVALKRMKHGGSIYDAKSALIKSGLWAMNMLFREQPLGQKFMDLWTDMNKSGIIEIISSMINTEVPEVIDIRTDDDKIVKWRMKLERALSLVKYKKEEFDALEQQIDYSTIDEDKKKIIFRIKEDFQDYINILQEGIDYIDGVVKKEEVDLNEIMDRVKTRASKKKWGVTVDFKPGTLPRIWANPRLIEAAVANIVYNAKKEGIEKVTIETKTVRNKGGEEAVIRISDQGPGFPEGATRLVGDEFGRIFQQAFAFNWHVGKGTGFGLGETREYIEEKHNGTISLESAKGKGSVFTITFPLIRNQGAAAFENIKPHRWDI